MSQDAYRLISPDGKETELQIHSGTVGPDLIDISSLYREQGVFTFDPGFISINCLIGPNAWSPCSATGLGGPKAYWPILG